RADSSCAARGRVSMAATGRHRCRRTRQRPCARPARSVRAPGSVASSGTSPGLGCLLWTVVDRTRISSCPPRWWRVAVIWLLVRGPDDQAEQGGGYARCDHRIVIRYLDPHVALARWWLRDRGSVVRLTRGSQRLWRVAGWNF